VVTLVNLRAYWRFLRVSRQFLPLVLAYTRDRRRFLVVGGRRRVGPEVQRRRAQRLLDSLLTLGPTFIKLGQLLSTRPDVLPPTYVDVLSRLQDDVPAAPWDQAREVLEAEVGPVEEAFEEFDTEAISGASLGQVYTATYRGEEVAVKVRRPGVESLVEADLKAIGWLLPVLLWFVDENRAFSMRNVADEFDKTIREEMDYGREARMLAEIRENFADNDAVVMPQVVPELSSSRVLTMEYVDGVKITDVRTLDEKGIDRSALAETLQRVYLQMMIEDGVFHADPHPGNLAVTDDGRVVFYDFGMSGRVSPGVQNQILDFYRAVASQNIDAILDTLVQMGTLSPEADRGVMSDVMELAIQDARGEDIEQYRVQQIVDQVENTIYDFPLRMPRNLALVLRVVTVVEGVCVTLDEDFDFIGVATGYLREQGYFEETVRNQARDTARQIQRSSSAAVRVPPKLERTLDRIERSNLEIKADIEDPDDVLDLFARRIVYGLLVAVGGLSVTLLYSSGQPVAAGVAAVVSLPIGIQLYRKFRKDRGLRTTPQFTRQNLRERREEEAAGGLVTDFGPEEAEPDPETGEDGRAGDAPGGPDGDIPGGAGPGPVERPAGDGADPDRGN
jgi:predicted unusual protein kinase regulating ubiquinone biosynthesis (AarF/ABC1/UbiB family)